MLRVVTDDAARAETQWAIDEICAEGARRMLAAALEAEVAEYVEQFDNVVGTDGRRMVVRNGRLPERDLVTGVGPVAIKQPRARDRTGQSKFSSRLLPPFMRRVPSVRMSNS